MVVREGGRRALTPLALGAGPPEYAAAVEQKQVFVTISIEVRDRVDRRSRVDASTGAQGSGGETAGQRLAILSGVVRSNPPAAPDAAP